jgi:hypothetical protein
MNPDFPVLQVETASRSRGTADADLEELAAALESVDITNLDAFHQR